MLKLVSYSHLTIPTFGSFVNEGRQNLAHRDVVKNWGLKKTKKRSHDGAMTMVKGPCGTNFALFVKSLQYHISADIDNGVNATLGHKQTSDVTILSAW